MGNSVWIVLRMSNDYYASAPDIHGVFVTQAEAEVEKQRAEQIGHWKSCYEWSVKEFLLGEHREKPEW